MGKLKAETRIKREREKLAEVFAKMDENKRKTAEKLMDNAAFMAVTLEDLRDSINENGCVSEYQNGENQFGTKKSPEVEVYNTMIKNYTTVIKTLCDLLPESNGEMNALTEWQRTCPMINSQGFCESAWTRASQVTECPHRKMRETVSNLNTGNEK